jgi:2-dehydropantoate 2-reductase
LRITIFGAGGIGGHVAARLAHAGYEVGVIARGDHLRAMQQHGLRLQVEDQIVTAKVEATDDLSALGYPDFLIVSVKRTSLPAAIPSIERLIGEKTRVVFIMNGLPWWFGDRDADVSKDLRRHLDPGGRLAALASEDRQIWSVITSGGAIVEPGLIRSTTPKTNIIRFGRAVAHDNKDIAALAEMFKAGGYDAAVSADIRKDIWQKILINAGQATVATVTNRNHLQVTSDPETRALIMAMIGEIVAVGKALGIHLDVDAEAMTSPGKYGEHIPSLLQDLRAERQLEIDGTILAVRQLARSKGVKVPHLESVAAIIAAMSDDIVRNST